MLLLLFSKRLRLAELYEAWIAKNNIRDCPLSVVSFLTMHGLIDQEKAIKFLSENDTNEVKNNEENETIHPEQNPAADC
jgi:hypothetical protein